MTTDMPADRSPASPATAPPRHSVGSNEPARALSTFVGRDSLLAELRALLDRDDVRLLTLTGPGGVGKTRLAMEVARHVEASGADVWRVPLAAIRDPSLVGLALARAADVPMPPDRPVEVSLAAALANRRGVLLLDTFEHVTDAVPLLAELVAVCPGLTLLVTSRTTLRLSAEYVVDVPPLSLSASDGDAGRSEAVRLFLDRAGLVRPDFVPTAGDLTAIQVICERLDGLPLAIELAAARTTLLSLPDLLARLDHSMVLLTGGPIDTPPRHRTMRHAIDWSYSLLSPDEQRLFRCLAVFDAAATLGAIEAIGDEMGHGKETVLAVDLLSALVDHHLVTRVDAPDDPDEPRFAMPETIREFAQETLVSSGDEVATRDAHAAIFFDLATEGETHLVREVDPVWLDRLEADHPNLRGALAWTLRDGSTPERVETGVRLAGTLWLFWYYHSHLIEGRAWLERALAVRGGMPEAARARVLVGLGMLLHFSGEQRRARRVLLRGLDLLRTLGDRSGMAYALTGLGNVAEDIGRYDDAARAFSEARTLFSELGDQVNVAVTLYHLGVVAVGQDDLELATSRLDEAVAMSRGMNDPWSTAASLSYLGLVRVTRGELVDAASHLGEALALHRTLGTTERIVEGLRRVAMLALARGDPHAAIQLFAAADAHGARIGTMQGLPERELYARVVTEASRLLDRVAGDAARLTGAALSLDAAVAEAERQIDEAAPPRSVTPETQAARSILSPREMDVLRLLVEGKSDAEIAALLGISRRTASTHATHIYGKLGVTSRAAAVAVAMRHDLV